MNKKGFLLIECISALVMLTSLTLLCAWYLWRNVALQNHAMQQLTCTTMLSTLSEQLRTHGVRSLSQDDLPFPITYQALMPQSFMEGLWSTLPSTISYRIYELSAYIGKADDKQEKLTWYVGSLNRT